MTELCTLTVSVPVWFLWTLVGALYISVVLAIVQAVVDYKLKRLKLQMGRDSDVDRYRSL